MDVKRFLSEFSHIVSAPGGTQKVRELILHLSIHGKLGAGSESNFDTAQQLINEAAILRQSEQDARENRAKPQLDVIPESYKLDYPTSWVVTRLGSVVHLVSGQHLSAEEQNNKGIGTPYLTGASDFGALYPVVARWTSVDRAVAKQGDILISVKGTIGKINLLNLTRAVLGRQLMAIRALAVDPAFIVLILRANENYFLAKGVGIAISGISRKDILQLIVGIPSLDEQKRIVAKVDELMALCDRLEAQQQGGNTLRSSIRTFVIDELADSKTTKDLISTWNRAHQHWASLLRSSDDILQFQDVIFHLGVTGKLTPNADTNLSVAILENQRESAYKLDIQTLHSTRIPALPAFKSVVFPALPEGWLALSLESACTFIIDCSHSTPEFVNHGYYCIDTTCIQPGTILWSKARKVSASSFAERTARLKPRRGDVLFSREGTIGTAVAISEDVDLCLGQRMMMFRFAPWVLPEFAEIYLRSRFFKKQFAPYVRGVASKHLNIEDIRKLIILVPSLWMQHSIVETVKRLLKHCHTLNTLLVQMESTACNFSVALVASITGVRSKSQEKMKVPKTELIANLRMNTSPANRDHAPLAAILLRNNGALSAKTLWNISGLEIDDFYQQLKFEMAKGWIVQPEMAYMKEVEVN